MKKDASKGVMEGDTMLFVGIACLFFALYVLIHAVGAGYDGYGFSVLFAALGSVLTAWGYSRLRNRRR